MDNSTKHQELSREEIARLAYQIWEQRGHPQCCEVEIWLEAERQICSAKDPSQEQRTASTRSADTPALQAQPRQSPAKSASLARSRTRRHATTKTEGEMKKATPLTTIPPAGHIKPAGRELALP